MRGVVVSRLGHLGDHIHTIPSAETVAVALRRLLKHYYASSTSTSTSTSTSGSSSSILSFHYYYYHHDDSCYYYYNSSSSSSSTSLEVEEEPGKWNHKEPPSFYYKKNSYYDGYTSLRRHRHYGHVRHPPVPAAQAGGILGRPFCCIPSSFRRRRHRHPCYFYYYYYHQHPRGFFTRPKEIKNIPLRDAHSQRAVMTALWCNFLVFSLKFGVWLSSSSHVMLAEVVHSVADFANQALLAYGLSSSRRAPDALHPYGYSKERFVWSLISAVGIFCLGSGATIVHGIQHLWTSRPPENIQYAALVIGGSFLIEGASLVVAIDAVRKGAASEGMKLRDYIWRGHDPTAVAVMTEDGAAVSGLLIAGASLVTVNATGNAIYDPIGSIIVGNLLGMVAVFLIQRNRHALIGRAMDQHDMEKVLHFLKNDPVVDALYDCKSEVIGPGFFRFKAEIDFNGVVLVQNYLSRTGREEWARQFRDAAEKKDDAILLKVMSNYGEEVVTALGSEVDRLEKEIQEIVPGIRHVDIEAHNPIVPTPP